MATGHQPWEDGEWIDRLHPDASGRAGNVVSRWQQPLWYWPSQVLMLEMGQFPWPLESGVRRPLSVFPKRTAPVRRAMGEASASLAILSDLWHARGEILPSYLSGALDTLASGGDEVLNQGDYPTSHGGWRCAGPGEGHGGRRSGMCRGRGMSDGRYCRHEGRYVTASGGGHCPTVCLYENVVLWDECHYTQITR